MLLLRPGRNWLLVFVRFFGFWFFFLKENEQTKAIKKPHQTSHCSGLLVSFLFFCRKMLPAHHGICFALDFHGLLCCWKQWMFHWLLGSFLAKVNMENLYMLWVGFFFEKEKERFVLNLHGCCKPAFKMSSLLWLSRACTKTYVFQLPIQSHSGKTPVNGRAEHRADLLIINIVLVVSEVSHLHW